MAELAPWESPEGTDSSGRETDTRGAGQDARRRLPEIYRRGTEAFVVRAGNVVPRPPKTPRPLERRAKLALLALVGVVIAGLGWAGVSWSIFSELSGPTRVVYAGLGVLLAAIALIVLLTELPRVNAYRFGTFVPGVLVYGSRVHIEKVVGAGVDSVTTSLIRGSGTGLLSMVLDRSSHKAAPPEVAALHIIRGNTAALVGIEWEAVHELSRGDIVWYMEKAPGQYLLFHKLVPYAPFVAQDAATRNEVFAALRVGENLFRDHINLEDLDATKVVKADEGGQLMARETAPSAPPSKKAGKGQSGLSDSGATLGGVDQFDQSADADNDDPKLSTGKTGKHKISEEGKSLGSYGQVDQVETFED